jgi:hypothetical protein
MDEIADFARFLGSTTNPERGGENSVFRFPFSES